MCPPLSDVLPRCFPYTTLNNLDFLNVKVWFGLGLANPNPNPDPNPNPNPNPDPNPNPNPNQGYVGGSTNPIFESHPEWWDVLMDLDTGKVLVSGTGANGR